MLKWLKRKAKQNEEPTYCGTILMRSEWYQEQVEAALIDHKDSLVMVWSRQMAAELEARGYKNVTFVGPSAPLENGAFWRRVREWFYWNVRG